MNLKQKKLTSVLVLLSFLSYMPLSSTMAFALDAGALPDLNNSVNGYTSVSGNKMDVVVDGGAGAVGQFDWNSFNVGSGAQVNFGFTNVSQTSLNRVLASGNLSQIYGKLTNSCVGADCTNYMGTGKVILINPNGIMFGAGSEVDLNSFTATTFDLNGAKNLDTFSSDADRILYAKQLNVNNAEFIRNGALPTVDGAEVKLEGSEFTIDKSLALAADNIAIKKGLMPDNVTYKESLIKTSIQPNYGGDNDPSKHWQTFSNVRIVTGDGVNFTYEANGNIKNHTTFLQQNPSFEGNVEISDSQIESGGIYIDNANAKENSDINIKNSVIKGYKLIEGDYGDIVIQGQNDIIADNSSILTENTRRIDDHSINTNGQNGGRVKISAGKNVQLKDSKISTAHSNQDFSTSTTGKNAGDVYIESKNNNVNIENTNIHSKGNLTVEANKGSIKTNDAALVARNYDKEDTGAASIIKKLVLNAKDAITLDKTYSESTDDTTLKADALSVQNGSTLHSNTNINMFGKDTTIADSTLQFKGLNFVEDEDVLNNVTISGTTGFNNYADNLNLTTNGNLVISANNLVKRGFGSTVDDSTLDVNVTLKELGNYDSIALESTKGKVEIKDNSNITADAGDITIKALDKTNGETFIKDSTLTAAGNVDIKQALTHNAGNHITKNSTINAKNIKLTTTNSDADINADLANFANLNYSERLVLNAGKDNNITGTGDLNALNVDFNAAGNNNLNITGNIKTDNSTFNGNINNITATGDVTLKNTTVKAKDSATPENTKTIVNAGGNFTTDGTVLALNQTKLIANADKDTNIALSGADNKKAGIEINAKYNSNQLSDKTVTINAADNKLAISKIKSGNLNLDKNDTFLAAVTDLTASDIEGITADTSDRAYIEVANWGKFNLDEMDDLETDFNQPDSFTYTDHFVNGKYTNSASETIDTFKKHFIEFKNNTMEKFLLVYEKPVSVTPPPVIDNEPNILLSDSLINQLRLPRQLEPTSRIAPITNNTTDPTSGIVNAAARVEVDENATVTKQDEDEFEI